MTEDEDVEMFPHTPKIVDLFPITPDINCVVSGHVETVVLMSKVKE